MAKRSREQINMDERKLLTELQENSSESIDKLAKRCGFSRQKVWRIVKRLEKNKTIWGYHAVVDQSKLELKRYLILIKRTTKPMEEKALDAMVKSNPKGISESGVGVDSSFFVHGRYDWVLNVTASGIRQVKRFCEAILRTFPGHVADIQVLEILFPMKKSNMNNPYPEGIKDFFLIKE